jgi:hypothetical protein
MKKSNTEVLKENKTKYNNSTYITNEGYEIKIIKYIVIERAVLFLKK